VNKDTHVQQPTQTSTATARASSARIMGAASLMSFATSLSRIGGLVREQLFAALLGAGFYSDAFVVAFRIPNLLRDLLAEGALSTAFVPTFTRTLEARGREAAFALGNLVLTTLAVVTGIVVVVGWIAADPIVHLIAPGFADTPGKTELTALLTRILFPFLPLVALAAVLMGMLNAQGRFFVPALAPVMFNLAAIVVGAALLVIQTDARTAVLVWTLGVLVGGAMQLGLQVPLMLRAGWRYRARFLPRFDDPGLRQILRLMAPAVIGLSATQLNILVNNVLASQLAEGSPSWINYAFRLMQLPIGVFGVAVATVNLAAVSRSAAAGDMTGFRSTLAASIRLVAFLTLPATAGLVALREPIIDLLYEHGRFTSEDTLQTAHVLSMYAIGLFAYAAVKVIAPAFYALGATRVPLLASVSAVACNITVNLLLYRRLGAPGLALGTAVAALVNVSVLYVAFVRRWGGLGEAGLGGYMLRVGLAAGAMGIACRWVSERLLARIGRDDLSADLVVTLTPIVLGVALYAFMAHLLRLHEMSVVVLRLRSRLRRR
jgi:putative peptidoglycan lipid II flippase